MRGFNYTTLVTLCQSSDSCKRKLPAVAKLHTACAMPFALPVLPMVAAASSTSVAPFTMHLTILPLTYCSECNYTYMHEVTKC
jgi:hypothetical protein